MRVSFKTDSKKVSFGSLSSAAVAISKHGNNKATRPARGQYSYSMGRTYYRAPEPGAVIAEKPAQPFYQPRYNPNFALEKPFIDAPETGLPKIWQNVTNAEGKEISFEQVVKTINNHGCILRPVVYDARRSSLTNNEFTIKVRTDYKCKYFKDELNLIGLKVDEIKYERNDGDVTVFSIKTKADKDKEAEKFELILFMSPFKDGDSPQKLLNKLGIKAKEIFYTNADDGIALIKKSDEVK